MAEKKVKRNPLPKGARRRRKPVGASTGLAASELQAAAPPGAVAELHQLIEVDEGKVLSVYRDPYGGQWLVQAALPIDLVEPTPYQRNLSDTHVRKLEGVIGKIGRFLDPIIAVRIAKPNHAAKYWTPNGNHRLSAMRISLLGAAERALLDLQLCLLGTADSGAAVGRLGAAPCAPRERRAA